jgi:hypothetical protein
MERQKFHSFRKEKRILLNTNYERNWHDMETFHGMIEFTLYLIKIRAVLQF